jgi:uncharacterized membrane protein
MAKLVATFANTETAERAIEALKRAGYEDKEISLVSKDERESRQGGEGGRAKGQTRDSVADGTAWGAGIGAGATLLASAGLLVIPGIGPLLALGPLAAGLTGAAAGGLVGAFVDWGIPAGESEHLEKEVKEGRAVLLIDARQRDDAEKLLRRQGALEVRQPA